MIAPKKDLVILLHGIALNKASLWFLSKRIEKAGYNVLPLSYPSTRLGLDDLADWLASNHLQPEQWEKYGKIHFVAHSMGGLVVRRTLDKFKDIFPNEKIGRTVMIGSPNGGSELADLMEKFPPYHWFYGPAGKELSVKHQSIRNEPLRSETGIIAGSSKWLYPLSGLFIKGPHDGRVAVEKTKLAEMKDHIVLNSSHTFMIYRSQVAAQTIHFLEHGTFNHDA